MHRKRQYGPTEYTFSDSEPHRGRRTIMIGTAATTAAILIGGGLLATERGEDDQRHQEISASDVNRGPQRPIDDIIDVEYGGFAAYGDPSLFVDTQQALTVQLRADVADVTGEAATADIQFIAVQVPEGQEPTEDSLFSNTFVYGSDGVPYPAQTAAQLAEAEQGRFTVTAPLLPAQGTQELYIIPAPVGENLDIDDVLSSNRAEIQFSYDTAGDVDLASIPSRG